MKVIDILQRIANGEEVPLIKYKDKILHWNEEKDRFEDKDGMSTLYEMDFSELNDEVEIIEKPKNIKKLDENNTNILTNIIENRKKINEIIDKINGGTNGE